MPTLMFLDTDTAAPVKFLVIDHFHQFNFSLAYPHLQQRIRGARVRMRGEARRINNPNTANMPTTWDDNNDHDIDRDDYDYDNNDHDGHDDDSFIT